MTINSERPLTVEDYYGVLLNGEQVILDEATLKRVGESHRFLLDFAKDKIIYGVNTGFGPMAQYRISNEDREKLQYNLIRSHASGTGEPLPELYVKAAMISRLKSLSLGYSGVHPYTIELLTQLINKNIIPYIPQHGGVGASGDLVQLSHLALVLIGEGEVYYKGEKRFTKDVFKELSIKPLEIKLREGLGLINGTSVMSGIGIVNLIYAKRLANWSVMASSMINEIVESFDDHFSTALNATKKHKGQQKVARAMQKILSDSGLVKKRQDHLYNGKHVEKVFKQKIQEYYSLRCVPQVLGPICDTIANAEKVLTDEVNSANDNPVIDFENGQVYHGGNFHGDYVSLEMDKLKIAVTKLSMLAERQLNFLMNNKLNEILKPFVNLGTPGLNLGLQGTQFTATSTVAENQTLSNPVYVHSIPNNNDNQDIVSMGTNAALLSRKVIENSYEVLAIEFMAIVYAVEYLGCESRLSGYSRRVFNAIKSLIRVTGEDVVKYTDIEKIRDYIHNNTLDILN